VVPANIDDRSKRPSLQQVREYLQISVINGLSALTNTLLMRSSDLGKAPGNLSFGENFNI
jgi:hypothetical protein